MFLQAVMQRNAPLVRLAFQWQQQGVILPDTYLLDYDAIVENARQIKAEADRCGVKLFFMLKQIGRNPLIAKALAEMGYAGAVCVDFNEALTMIRNNVPIGNVGHLVQVPRAALETILKARPTIVTVYSLEKAREISEVCSRLGLEQPLMLRVLGKNDRLYPGQYGGFSLEELTDAAEQIESMPGVRVGGVCSFPCFLYEESAGDICPTPNLTTVQTAADLLRQAGYRDLMLNTPSATCVRSVPMIAAAGGTHGEPGHGLTGTTPYHAAHADAPERPAYVYVSEISHNLKERSYCYGGGFYRRGHLQNALVGTCPEDARVVAVTPPDAESIDYHFELQRNCPVSAGVVMAFRTQFFVTRSQVAVVRGLSCGKPELAGLYSALGQPLDSGKKG
ncbi:MAG: YhfX family PLP-dependent enzyme [Gemmiger sp.]